ncbi:MAG TPA: rRNA maturation RNase YbeY [Desulfomonilia bacterium]
MNIIDVQDIQDNLAIDPAIVEKNADRILKMLGKKNCELSLVLCDDRYIRRLNKQYLGKDKPTNVISFPQQEGEGIEGNHLGDIVISAQRASSEAGKSGITFEERLLQLIVHGICHLCGYDHEDVSLDKAQQMEKKELELLEKLAEKPV